MRARNVLVIATALLGGCAFNNGGNGLVDGLIGLMVRDQTTGKSVAKSN